MSLIYLTDTAQNSADLENKEKCSEGWLPNHELNKDNRHAKVDRGKNEASTLLKDLHATKKCWEQEKHYSQGKTTQIGDAMPNGHS